MSVESLKEKIRNVDDIDKKDVFIPQWDLTIQVRSLSGKMRAYLVDHAMDRKEGTVIIEQMYPSLLVACCYDPETGERIFQDGDIEWLMSKSGAAIDLLASEAMEISGLRGDAVRKAEKN